MKRYFLALALIVLSVTAWGQNKLDLSFGGGAVFGTDFGGGIENKINYAGQSFAATAPVNYMGGGIHAFFDATYIEAAAGLLFGGGTLKTKIESSLISQTQTIGDYNFMGLNLGIVGKYPFAVSPRIKLFPLVGIDYLIALSIKFEDEKVDDPTDWNQLWFKFGGGIDFNINTSLYFRLEALYGFRLPSKGEKDFTDYLKSGLQDEFQQQYGIAPDITSDTLLGHGLTVRAAIGYKLK
jgi:hypothetical protein